MGEPNIHEIDTRLTAIETIVNDLNVSIQKQQQTMEVIQAYVAKQDSINEWMTKFMDKFDEKLDKHIEKDNEKYIELQTQANNKNFDIFKWLFGGACMVIWYFLTTYVIK